MTAEQLSDASHRDVYGDVVVELASQNFDLAVRYAGDFMLYFASEQTGEIRRLTKAREIWDTFVESNYHAAEPGLILCTSVMGRHKNAETLLRALREVRDRCPQARLVLYGPYLEPDVPTAPGNLAFDRDLRARDPQWGLRHLPDVVEQAGLAGLALQQRHAMPANNLLLVFGRAQS